MGAQRAGSGDDPDRGWVRRLHRGLLFALAVLATLSIGIVVAHWGSQAVGSVLSRTGEVALDVAGALTFDSPACGPGEGTRQCDKFDSDVVGSPITYSADGVTFSITGWVHKHGAPSEDVGFYYTVTGGDVDIRVKSGRTHLEATLTEGSGLWLNPACEGDPGPGGAVTCSPKNTRSISYIAFCLEVPTPPTCPPVSQTLSASNAGSIPLQLETWLADSGGAPHCDVFDLTIQRVVNGGSTDPPLYQGPLCGLLDTALLLETQLDPGESVEYVVTVSLTRPNSEVDGTTVSLTARFQATQWNDPGGWADRVDVPLTIPVADLLVEDVSRSSPPNSGPDQNTGDDVETPAEGEPDEDPPPEEPPPAPDAAGLTGIIWLDQNADGVRLATEPGLVGVVVRLLSGGVEVATTTTDAGGAYSFLDLSVGIYTIEIDAPSGHSFTSPAQGGDPSLDSDVTTTDQVGDRLVGELALTLQPGMATGAGDAGLVIEDGGGE